MPPIPLEMSGGAHLVPTSSIWLQRARPTLDVMNSFFLGRQTFRVEEAFSSGQIGGWVTPELALESACCLALSELLAQSTPLRQILGLQLGGAKGMELTQRQATRALQRQFRRDPATYL